MATEDQGIFLYFLPGLEFGQVTQDTLANNPILAGPFSDLIRSPRVFSDNLIGANILNRGPEGAHGCIVGAQACVDIGQIPGYFPARQTWQKFGDIWVGYETNLKPGPGSLRRKRQFRGAEVTLGDGEIWIGPTLLKLDPLLLKWSNLLPAVFGVDEHLKPTATIQKDYLPMMAMLKDVHRAMYGGGKASVEQCFEWASHLLQLNYRLGPVEAAILKLFDDDSMVSVLHAAIDDSAFSEMASELIPVETQGV